MKKILNEIKGIIVGIISLIISIMRAVFCPMVWKIQGKNSDTLIESYKLVIKGIKQ